MNNVAWYFTVFPSQTFKNNFGAALLPVCPGHDQVARRKTAVH